MVVIMMMSYDGDDGCTDTSVSHSHFQCAALITLAVKWFSRDTSLSLACLLALQEVSAFMCAMVIRVSLSKLYVRPQS